MGSVDRLAARVKGVSYGGRPPGPTDLRVPSAEGSSRLARKAREERNDHADGIRGPRKQGTT